jgi:hypothetical protein
VYQRGPRKQEVKDEATGKERYVGLVPHEWRHTAASLAIAAGA